MVERFEPVVTFSGCYVYPEMVAATVGDYVRYSDYAALEAQLAERPRVKALEWHKSHMPSWNDDWHTTTPIIYTVRCADENGWKWSFHGGQGYERSPDSAKAAAQADYERRILSTLALPGLIEPTAATAVDQWQAHKNYDDEPNWPPQGHPLFSLFHNARLKWPSDDDRPRYERIVDWLYPTPPKQGSAE